MGTRKNRLVEAVLTSTHNICFEQKYKNISDFLSENFLVVKCSVYLNRRVFVMISEDSQAMPQSRSTALPRHQKMDR